MRRKYSIEPAYIRGIYGKTLKSIDSDKFINKALNRALASILGVPGESAGKSEGNIQEQSSAYNAGQMDDNKTITNDKYAYDIPRNGASFGQSLALGGLGFLANQITAAQAYRRQEEFYENHLSMPAKVQEYQDAGLNPMALGGAGVGATSAPSVPQADAGNGMLEALNTILGYKARMSEIDVQRDSNRIREKGIDSEIGYRAKLGITQDKINQWYDTLQNANLDKIFAETSGITISNYISSIFGKYAETNQIIDIESKLKQLKVADSVITHNEAAAANQWANANLSRITAQFTPGLMQAQTQRELSSAANNMIDTSVKEFELDYKRNHNGAEAPKGMLGAVIGVCSEAANRITSGISSLF